MSNQDPTDGSDKAATDSRYEIERPELADARWIDDVCIAYNMMIAQDGNILYFLGGLQVTTSSLYLSSSHLYIMDLTAPIDLSSDHTSFIKVRRIPDHVPRVKWGNMFVENNTLRLFGGMHEYFPIFNANGSRSYEERVPIADKLWTYDIKEDKWDNGEASSKIGMDTVGRALIAWDRKDGVNGEGWIYGGTVETGDWIVGKDATGTNKKLKDLKGFIKVTGVEESQTWRLERLNDNEQQVGAAEQGDLLLLEELGEKGVLVMVGGRSSSILKSLKEIQVYDIASSTWYTQPTTADKGNYPHERQEACAVVVSAPDKSSHNIYVYGGFAIPGEPPFSDLYILTLPAFHWVYVGTGTELPKVCHKCGVVNERYMVSFRGLGVQGAGCDSNGGIQILDLTRLEWTGRMEPVVKNTKRDGKTDNVKRQGENEKSGNTGYEVPEKLYRIIGGNAQGGATFTAPRSSFVDDRLQEIFRVPKTTGTGITSPTITPTFDSSADSSPTRKLSTGVIAAVALGAFVLIFILLSALYLLRRIHRRRASLATHGPQPAELEPKYPPPTEPDPKCPPQEMPSPYTGQDGVTYYGSPVELPGYGPNDGLLRSDGTPETHGTIGAVPHKGEGIDQGWSRDYGLYGVPPPSAPDSVWDGNVNERVGQPAYHYEQEEQGGGLVYGDQDRRSVSPMGSESHLEPMYRREGEGNGAPTTEKEQRYQRR